MLMTVTKLNIALIDDHQILSQSLAGLLSKYEFIKTIKTFPSAGEFLEDMAAYQPDVVVMTFLCLAWME